MKSFNIITFFLIALLLAGNEGVGATGPATCFIGPVAIRRCDPNRCFSLCQHAYGDQVDGKCADNTCNCYKPC
ncbi:hypothetical protein LINGRAHAP2_LOCUS36335 [Linum grandiflorum]